MLQSNDQNDQVLLQPVPRWGGAGNSILGAHMGNVGYLLPAVIDAHDDVPVQRYSTNEEFWREVIGQHVSAGRELVLDGFQVTDWFPRAPGLYHTREAAFARDEAYRYVHPRMSASPIRKRGSGVDSVRGRDYTVVFTPEGKSSMLQGGIGTIRLKPIRILGQPHWLMTATADGMAHTGVPIAVPLPIYSRLIPAIEELGSVTCTLFGELDFLEDPFSRVFDTYVMVPRLYFRVTRVEPTQSDRGRVEASVAVSFVSDYEGSIRVYATYVTFQPHIKTSFKDAVSWLKQEYVEGQYHGRIITDFDQTRTTFPEARLALSQVMDRRVPRGALREAIELMHATASFDAYFDELDKREFLFRQHKGQRTKVFISYAHAAERDTGWVTRIRMHLQGLVHESDLDVWDDTRIRAGEKWQDEIRVAINQTRVAILVLTPEFLASKFIREGELPLLLEAADAENATILCVCGSRVHLSRTLKRLQEFQFVNPLDRPLQELGSPEQEAAFVKLAEAVERATTKE